MTEFSLIYEKIMSLPQKTAETMILFHISDLSLEDIRSIQGGSLSGVKLRLKRGREKLLEKLNSPEQISERVLKIEHELLPDVLEQIAIKKNCLHNIEPDRLYLINQKDLISDLKT